MENKKFIFGLIICIFLIIGIMFVFVSGSVSAITWRHSGTDTMSLSDAGNLNVLGNITAPWFKGLWNGSSDYFTQADWNTNYTANNANWLLDTDTFVANYSTFLNHIDWSDAVNGTLATEADLTTEETLQAFNNATQCAQIDSKLFNTGDTATGNYSFDSGTLFIDSTGNRIFLTKPRYTKIYKFKILRDCVHSIFI